MLSNSDLKRKVAKYTVNYILDWAQSNIEQLDHSFTLSDSTDRGKINRLWIGLGSGSTVQIFIKELSQKLKTESLDFILNVVSSSIDTEILCRNQGFFVYSLDDIPETSLQFYVDSADEINDQKLALKGVGGALTREKIVRLAAKCFIIMISESKKSSILGVKSPVVCEILPFGYIQTMKQLLSVKPRPTKIKLRNGKDKLGPTITDNNNFLVDMWFAPITNEKLIKLEVDIKSITGVIETGIFSKNADLVFVSTPDKIIPIS